MRLKLIHTASSFNKIIIRRNAPILFKSMQVPQIQNFYYPTNTIFTSSYYYAKSNKINPFPALKANKKEPEKRSILRVIRHEILHYYHGFRLLFIDIRISSKLLFRLMLGKELTRREHQQLYRTATDIFRLVPFSPFIILPFMELLIPIIVKIFPNMLPSTFESPSQKAEKLNKQLKIRLHLTTFLDNTLSQLKIVQKKGGHYSNEAKEFVNFYERVCSSGKIPTNEEIMKFSKLFSDKITLDNMERRHLVDLCKLLELRAFGPNSLLAFQLRVKIKILKFDDQKIQKEGLDNLTIQELQVACRERGMRAIGLSETRLKNQLRHWLELSLNESIPSSLLLLSRVLYISDDLIDPKQLTGSISQLAENAAREAKYEIGEKEGKIDNKTKLEIVKREQELIEKERKEMSEINAQANFKTVREKSQSTDNEELPPGPDLIDIIQEAVNPKEITKEPDYMIPSPELPANPIIRKQINQDKIEIMENVIKGLNIKMEKYQKQAVEACENSKIANSKEAQALYKRMGKLIVNMTKTVQELKKEQKASKIGKSENKK